MLSIGRLGAGAEEYYVAYAAKGNSPGRWLGSAEILGLEGEVEADDLRALLAGDHPRTGERLAPANRRRPGFDLTFSAPKSASLLWALGDEGLAAQVVDAHLAAVAAALGYLQASAVVVRRGHDGIDQHDGAGLIAAGFEHRTSRADDPQVHTHVLVANLTIGPDGRYSALDARALYHHAHTAGALYRAQLRAELTERLGVRWTRSRKGLAEIEGVPKDVLRAFSRRRVAIEQRLAERGLNSREAAQVAALDTRVAKADVDPATLRREWTARAHELGFGPEQLQGLVRPDVRPTVSPTVSQFGHRAWLGLGRRLTEQASSFERRDVLTTLAAEAAQGAWVEELEAGADQFLASAEVVALGPDRCGNQRYSTKELLAIEKRLLGRAVALRRAGAGVVDRATLEAALASRPSLGEDQRAMVRRLTASGAGVEVVVGPAGAGKTAALDAARQAWQASGRRVIGCALAGRAAAELKAGAGIPSSTIDSLLAEVSRVGQGLPKGSIVVVDEAAMVGTRKLAKLLYAAERAEAKVVLVGDDRQLPAIEAGGAFAALARELGAVELTANRRQRHALERNALAALRAGKVDVALSHLERGGNVVAAPTVEAAYEALVADWLPPVPPART